MLRLHHFSDNDLSSGENLLDTRESNDLESPSILKDESCLEELEVEMFEGL